MNASTEFWRADALSCLRCDHAMAWRSGVNFGTRHFGPAARAALSWLHGRNLKRLGKSCETLAPSDEGEKQC